MSTYSNTQQNFYSSANPQGSYYGNVKNISIDDKLWRPSETSLNFISPKVSIGKEQRFKLHSIYWPKNNESAIQSSRLSKQRSDMDSMAKLISKRIDDQAKNQIRIKQRGSLNEKKIHQSFNQSTKKKNQMIKTEMKRFVLDQKNLRITQRLASPTSKRQSLLRDKNGMRSNLIDGDDQHLHEVVKCEVQKMAQTTGFMDLMRTTAKTQTTSRRLNLNLPDNYYPGVGTYQIKRYLQDLDDLGRRRAVTARTNSTKQYN